MKKGLEWQIERKLGRGVYEVRGAQAQPSGMIAVFGLPTIHTIEPGDAGPVDPFLELNTDDATALMDELWRAGVRPSEHGSPGQLKATERHLEDMRRLVFEPPGPPRIVMPGNPWEVKPC
jgi:hypothetical protein